MKVHILLGAPGSGKGTQAKLILENFQLTHLSTGDILRDAVSKETALGLKVKTIMAAGQLVDDDTINALVFERLSNESQSVLLDGYPRTMLQAQALQDFLSRQNLELGAVVLVDVPDGVLESRVVNRRLCSNAACGAIYHLLNSPPRVEGICDHCGSQLKHRADDTKEAFVKRMAEVNANLLPILQFYRDMGVLETVDGNRVPVQVFEPVKGIFGGHV